MLTFADKYITFSCNLSQISLNLLININNNIKKLYAYSLAIRKECYFNIQSSPETNWIFYCYLVILLNP